MQVTANSGQLGRANSPNNQIGGLAHLGLYFWGITRIMITESILQCGSPLTGESFSAFPPHAEGLAKQEMMRGFAT